MPDAFKPYLRVWVAGPQPIRRGRPIGVQLECPGLDVDGNEHVLHVRPEFWQNIALVDFPPTAAKFLHRVTRLANRHGVSLPVTMIIVCDSSRSAPQTPRRG